MRRGAVLALLALCTALPLLSGSAAPRRLDDLAVAARPVPAGPRHGVSVRGGEAHRPPSACSPCVAPAGGSLRLRLSAFGTGAIEVWFERSPRNRRVLVLAAVAPDGSVLWRAQLSVLAMSIGVDCVVAAHA